MSYYWSDWPTEKGHPVRLPNRKVLLRVCEYPTHTTSGIILPYSQAEFTKVPDRGVIENIGLDVKDPDLNVGDVVLYTAMKGDDYQRGKDHMLLIEEEDLSAVLGPEADGPRWF